MCRFICVFTTIADVLDSQNLFKRPRFIAIVLKFYLNMYGLDLISHSKL